MEGEIGMIRASCWVGLIAVVVLGGALAGIADEEAWRYAEAACLSIGDVPVCSAAFEADGWSAAATVRVIVDQDSPFWGVRSTGQKTCEFERPLVIDAPTEIRLSVRLIGSLRLENEAGEAWIVTRVSVADAATSEPVQELEISQATAPGRFVRSRTSAGTTAIEVTALLGSPSSTVYVVQPPVPSQREMPSVQP